VKHTTLAAFLVGLVALIGAIVLTAIHIAVPTYLWAIAFAGLTAGAGLAVPGAPPLTLTELTDALPKLLANVPGAVKAEDVAKEVIRQLLTPGVTTTPAPTPLQAALGVIPSP
jgi:hypothetical protein